MKKYSLELVDTSPSPTHHSGMENTGTTANYLYILYLDWIPKAVTHSEAQFQSQGTFCPKWANEVNNRMEPL